MVTRTEGNLRRPLKIKRWQSRIMGKKRDLSALWDRHALESKGGIANLDGVWRAIGKDKGIRDLVQKTGVNRSQLIQDLTALVRWKAHEKGVSWPRRHLVDLLAVTVMLLGVWLALRAIPLATAVGVALRDLRTGERLSDEALHRAVDLDSTSGLRLKRGLRKGEYVFPDDLEPLPSLKPQDLQGRLSLRLRLEPADVPRLPSLPGHATFAVVSSGGGGSPPRGHVLRDVPVLTLEREESSTFVVAALTDTQIQCLLPLLPNARVLLLRPPP